MCIFRLKKSNDMKFTKELIQIKNHFENERNERNKPKKNNKN